MTKEQYLEMLNWDTKLWTILDAEEVKPLMEIGGYQNYVYSVSPKGEKSFGKGCKVVKIEWMEKHTKKEPEIPAVPEAPKPIPSAPKPVEADVPKAPEITEDELDKKGKARIAFLIKNGLQYEEIDGTPSLITPDSHIFTQGELAKLESKDWQALTSTYSSFKVARMKEEKSKVEIQAKVEVDDKQVETKGTEISTDEEKTYLESHGWNTEKFLILEKGDWEAYAEQPGYELSVLDSANDEEGIKLFGKDARIVSIPFIESLSIEDDKEVSDESLKEEKKFDYKSATIERRQALVEYGWEDNTNDNVLVSLDEGDITYEDLYDMPDATFEDFINHWEVKAEKQKEQEKAVAEAKKKQEAEAKEQEKPKEKAIADGPRSATEEDKSLLESKEKFLKEEFEAWKKDFIAETEAEKKKIREEYEAKESTMTTGDTGGIFSMLSEVGFGQLNLSITRLGKDKFSMQATLDDFEKDSEFNIVRLSEKEHFSGDLEARLINVFTKFKK